MAKQFVNGNVYVFSNKKLKAWNKRNNNERSRWGIFKNGIIVTIGNHNNAFIGIYGVVPEWCKCIKNNN